MLSPFVTQFFSLQKKTFDCVLKLFTFRLNLPKRTEKKTVLLQSQREAINWNKLAFIFDTGSGISNSAGRSETDPQSLIVLDSDPGTEPKRGHKKQESTPLSVKSKSARRKVNQPGCTERRKVSHPGCTRCLERSPNLGAKCRKVRNLRQIPVGTSDISGFPWLLPGILTESYLSLTRHEQRLVSNRHCFGSLAVFAVSLIPSFLFLVFVWSFRCAVLLPDM